MADQARPKAALCRPCRRGAAEASSGPVGVRSTKIDKGSPAAVPGCLRGRGHKSPCGGRRRMGAKVGARTRRSRFVRLRRA